MSIFRDRLLAGRVAFITGGGSGIGRRIAERFSEHAATVVIAGRRPDVLAETKAVMDAAASSRIATEALDVRDYGALDVAMKRTRETFGPIDIVVAGAAGNFLAPAVGMSANAFKAVVDIDLLGTYNTVRAAYAHLRRPGASLLAISASHATVPIALQSHVCAAKAGVELLIKTLAIEWGPEGVRANCITPGPTADTEGTRRLAPTDEAKARVTAAVPLRRFGTKDELADLALFLCSTAAAYITGATFVCDGGSSLVRSSLGLDSPNT